MVRFLRYSDLRQPCSDASMTLLTQSILTAALGAMLLASAPAQAIDLDFSGSVGMGLIGTSGASAQPISPYATLDTRFDFSIETDGGVTIGLTVPLSLDGSNEGLTLRISDQD
jgi:hypothetical protein